MLNYQRVYLLYVWWIRCPAQALSLTRDNGVKSWTLLGEKVDLSVPKGTPKSHGESS